MHFIVNHLLAQHPQVRGKLRQYAGRSFAVHTLGMVFVAQIDETGYLKAGATPADCQIQLHDTAWHKLLQKQQVVSGDLDISGDYALAMALLPLLSQLDYRISADLRRFGATAAADFWDETFADLGQDLAENRDWLQRRISQRVLAAEKPLALHREWFMAHTQQVADLRDDVARLEARVNRLAHQAETFAKPRI